MLLQMNNTRSDHFYQVYDLVKLFGFGLNLSKHL